MAKNVTALKTASRAYFGVFVTGTQKSVTATFFGPKLSRPFFRCHGHFCENCHGQEKNTEYTNQDIEMAYIKHRPFVLFVQIFGYEKKKTKLKS